jgi:hypothetical protein
MLFWVMCQISIVNSRPAAVMHSSDFSPCIAQELVKGMGWALDWRNRARGNSESRLASCKELSGTHKAVKQGADEDKCTQNSSLRGIFLPIWT